MREVNCMLSGLTAKTLGRYQEATKMVEKTMENLASGTAELSSAEQVKVGRMNNTIHTLQTAHKVVKQNQDLLQTAVAGIDSIKDYTRVKTTWYYTSDEPTLDPFSIR